MRSLFGKRASCSSSISRNCFPHISTAHIVKDAGRERELYLVGRRGLVSMRVQASSGDDFDPFGEADDPPVDVNSPMFNSPIVAEEAKQIFEQFKQLSALQPKYNKFDCEGKRIFCDQMDAFCDRMKVFTTRYQLSDDAYSQEMIRRLSAQLLEVGMTIDDMYNGLVQTTKAMRQMLEEEERLGAEVVYKEPVSRMGEMPDFAKLMEDPEIAALLRDPEIIAIMQRCVRSPTDFALEAEKNPKIRKIMEKLFENFADGNPNF